ncbi:hypothetical protein BJF85_16725 [Saccharomonospora sp. CUA-673]|uniref:hypothetical protein n=1 Tax=Saccharomonospora sp. CUA-673 TaxID=1904969 RepID=UPI0009592EF6|nr:hypothetical protein [Saccharomonospora sp. CUA-673]OLT46487.1 hypothetical protein BJF85_16725 [Saccharomonospora sp. CUA-673]
MSVQQAATALEDALRHVDGARVYRDPAGAVADPPALLVGPPRLTWEGICGGPTSATFVVYVMAAMDERAVSRLWELVPVVAAAIDEHVRDAVVTEANPGVFDAGGNNLPSYELTVEVAL